MTDYVIAAEGLGKKYLIGHNAQKERNWTLRDAIARQSKTLVQRAGALFSGQQLIAGSALEEFWALKDAAFNVRQGEVVGIIGRNGAGKSTLLKVLSQITEPSAGRVAIRGRVASLLEVGTGFHQELTGRENIFLNGAILGMSRADIRKRFDEIVAFAEIDKFLDTPVKRYSSGMYVRLAFAVAAHLEPDVLIVDEVLAVGDAQFQKKCLGKMEEVAGQGGRTVLFVSHQMGMITSLCQRGILLEAGRIVFDGSASGAGAKYYNSDGGAPFSVDYTKKARTRSDPFATVQRAWIEDDSGRETGEVDIRSGFKVTMRYSINEKPPSQVLPFFQFYNSLGQCAFMSRGNFPSDEEGTYESTCCIPGQLLNSDTYTIDLSCGCVISGVHTGFHERSALSLVVVDPVAETLSGDVRNGYSGAFEGVVRPRLDWHFRKIS
jgi:homopolymeric O-antigen transport system ATP-binding protein